MLLVGADSLIVRFVKGSKVPAEQRKRETKGQKSHVKTEVKLKIRAWQLSIDSTWVKPDGSVQTPYQIPVHKRAGHRYLEGVTGRSQSGGVVAAAKEVWRYNWPHMRTWTSILCLLKRNAFQTYFYQSLKSLNILNYKKNFWKLHTARVKKANHS